MEKKKVDARNNTIDKGMLPRHHSSGLFDDPLHPDEDYISFLEYLEVIEKTGPPSLEALSKSLRTITLSECKNLPPEKVAAAQSAPQPTTTPLLEALKAEKSAQKDKEAIIRNHAHYKESAIIAKKEEAAKKKASAVAQQAQAQAAASIAAQKQVIDGGPTISQPTSRKAKKAAAAAQKAAAHDAQPTMRIQTAAPKQPTSAGGVSAPPSVPQHTITSTLAPPTAPHAHRERGHRGHKASGGSVAVHAKSTDSTATAAPASAEGSATAPVATVPSLPALGAPQTRRGRPVIGIGRHFEAALSGAVGSGGGSSERKRRGEKEKDKEGGAAAAAPSGPASGGSSAPEGKSAGGKHKDHHTSVGKHKGAGSGSAGAQPVVPNILQRSGVPTAPGEVSITQRPQSPREAQSGYQADAPPARGGGGGRKGRGRGRGGHRGG